jgi:glycosyltransferase involved in cell wall biosynthesis
MADPTIVILSHVDATATTSARARRVNAIIAALGKDVLLFQPGGRHPGCETRTLPWDLGRPPFPKHWSRHNFRFPRNRKLVRGLLDVIKPGLLLLTSIWDFPAVEHLSGVPMALDARRVEAEREDGRRVKGRMGPIERLERRVLRRVDHIFACTEDDHRAFQERYGVSPDRLSLVPDGVSTGELAVTTTDAPLARKWQARLEGRHLLWVKAEEDDPGTEDTLTYLNRVLLPDLERSHPGRFVVVVDGRRPDKFKAGDGLFFAHRAREVETLFPRAALILAPALHHAVDRLDMLELLATGKPVVATPRAVRDIACANGVHAVVEDSAGFAEAIRRLATDTAGAQAMAKRGQSFVRAMYDWRSIQSRWQVVVNRLAQESPTA